MPRYDFNCAAGHVTEDLVSRETRTLDCSCGRVAQREVVPSRVGVNGVTVPPMGERKIPLSQFTEAQHTIVYEAEKTGTPLPDLLGVAKKQAGEIQRHAPELIG